MEPGRNSGIHFSMNMKTATRAAFTLILMLLSGTVTAETLVREFTGTRSMQTAEFEVEGRTSDDCLQELLSAVDVPR